MPRGPGVYLLLPSIHDVIAAEQLVRRAGLWCDLIPKPTWLSTDCGMVLACRTDDKDAVVTLLQSAGLKILGIENRR